MSDWQAQSPLAKAVYEAGFVYVPGKDNDIIVSRQDALQRSFGFMWAYDITCQLLQMVIDCEPVYFTYGGKNWMIELWKGQYGIETGAEIGVYNQPEASPAVKTVEFLSKFLLPWEVTTLASTLGDTFNYYASATDAEELLMSYTLRRDKQILFVRGPEKHWWLTGFRWGEFSNPEQLTVDASITLSTTGMRDAFEAALQSMGYTHIRRGQNDTTIPPEQRSANTVTFTFDRPKTSQPITRTGETARQGLNSDLVTSYNQFRNAIGATTNDPNLMPEPAMDSPWRPTYDKVLGLFNAITGVGKKLAPATR